MLAARISLALVGRVSISIIYFKQLKVSEEQGPKAAFFIWQAGVSSQSSLRLKEKCTFYVIKTIFLFNIYLNA